MCNRLILMTTILQLLSEMKGRRGEISWWLCDLIKAAAIWGEGRRRRDYCPRLSTVESMVFGWVSAAAQYAANGRRRMTTTLPSPRQRQCDPRVSWDTRGGCSTIGACLVVLVICFLQLVRRWRSQWQLTQRVEGRLLQIRLVSPWSLIFSSLIYL